MHVASTLVPAFVALAIPFTSAQAVTTINPTTNWGTWEGWGTSLAWWAKAFGNRYAH
jgi:galactan endo-1,6-beta-galactosidase